MTSFTPKRFVILHHQVAAGFGRTAQDHFDWMFQTGPTLTTFATPIRSDMQTPFEVACSRLPDHRIAYLDFEGPIPDRGDQCDRGSVRRIAQGTFTEMENTPNCFSATLAIDSMNANVDFRQADESQWVLRFTPTQFHC